MTPLAAETLLRRIAERGPFPSLYHHEGRAVATDGRQLLALPVELPGTAPLPSNMSGRLHLEAPLHSITMLAREVFRRCGGYSQPRCVPCPLWTEHEWNDGDCPHDCVWCDMLGWVAEVQETATPRPILAAGHIYDAARIAELVLLIDGTVRLGLHDDGMLSLQVDSGALGALMPRSVPVMWELP